MEVDLSSIGLFVVNDFIEEKEEAELLEFISLPVKRKPTTSRNTVRRYGSSLPYSSNVLSNKIPEYFDKICNKLVERKLLENKPNSITVNQYLKGQMISPHVDSKSSGPIITILSLISPATMVFSNHKIKQKVTLLPRSVVQMKDEIRNEWEHSIEPVENTRYSIVFRHGEVKIS